MPGDVESLIKNYNLKDVRVGAIASHSALDVFDGAKDEGFKTIAICQKGRETPYLRFKRVIDEVIILEKFIHVINFEIIEKLKSKNVIMIPNRSFAVYVGYDNIENKFPIPIFGNRRLLRWEERVGEMNYYKLLDEAGIKRPRIFENPENIDRPVMVKLPEAKRRVERAFFIAIDKDDYYRKIKQLRDKRLIDNYGLKNASIEELILGAHFNVNYFRSIVRNEVEILSIDRRIQSNIDGLIRLPAKEQLNIEIPIRLIEVGHVPVTIRESLLEKLFQIGDKFVEATKKLVPPGVIGPFTLQLMITPELDVVVYDVAPRIGGGTNAYMGIGSQYSKLYFDKPVSLGRRNAIELRECIENNCIDKIVT